ncbi:response regulator transcription factor [Candidatus Methylospira mobilis]|uniref:Response regulator transcription factor n=1 Tax=Candidatus Methylospira mobilis TaxID=1808979 RepID=A0A5Q0BJP6_9GAMM|nr:response regulator transcription factor [Candidatus Methylospira mobilis]QFY42387.1 response regulator transcription factor [Candidatus Methylospira mobilis]WNV04513.1 response regulator transcription factor [Candidatus Methylospira mobilis]
MVQHIKFHIAVVEDDIGLCNDLVEFLGYCGFTASGFESAEAFYQSWHLKQANLVILDIALPGASGLQAAKWLRARSSAGIVMLTGMDSQSDQVVGLEAGADAYLVKNASLEVIHATCRSVLRRLDAAPLPASAQSWLLAPKAWQLTLPTGGKVSLTHTETLFLQCLLLHPGIPASRAELLAALGKADTLSNLRNLDNCAGRLRRKVLKEHDIEIPVRPSYGNGYTFTGDGEIDRS